ncbi:hypothetical protein HK100_000818 [Physocladia obscura]|uniref:AD domain-containing protein n=1 Tax=Physocladia obscura TaxID=109957 RepID=A0AAD5SY31_9FUNG|nr:hypothetical protein HK100_000818 [Physocladia obscura]
MTTETLIGQHVRVVLTTDVEYSGLVFAYERVLGLLVLQASGQGFFEIHLNHRKISAVKSASLVNASLSPQPPQPIQQQPQQQPQTPQQPPQQHQNKQTAPPKAIGAWATKPGAPTAAQLIAAKTTPTATTPMPTTVAAASIAAPNENDVALLSTIASPDLAPPKALLTVPTAPSARIVDVQKLLIRERAAVAVERASIKKIGPAGVPKQAQDIFNVLDKTLPTKWKGDTIIVLDEVMIMAPYGIDDIRGITQTAGNAVDRVQKIVTRVLEI